MCNIRFYIDFHVKISWKRSLENFRNTENRLEFDWQLLFSEFLIAIFLRGFRMPLKNLFGFFFTLSGNKTLKTLLIWKVFLWPKLTLSMYLLVKGLDSLHSLQACFRDFFLWVEICTGMQSLIRTNPKICY